MSDQLTTMSRKQLYDRAKELGLEVRWATSTRETLQALLRGQIKESLNLGEGATFEEQFDHLVALKLASTEEVFRVVRDERLLWGAFAKRAMAAFSLAALVMEQPPLELVREMGVLLVGEHYVRTHPMNPHDSVEALRKAKRLALTTKVRFMRDDCKRDVMHYIMLWEMALSADELKLYLA